MSAKLSDSGFSIGDVAVLRAGGPKVTVSNYIDGEIIVHWFANDKKVSASQFRPEQLSIESSSVSDGIDLEGVTPELHAKLVAMGDLVRPVWKVGDVAQLNSGGPQLSIRSTGDSIVDVDWMDSKGEHRKARFHPLQLKRPGDVSLTNFTDAELEETIRLLEGKG